ncbi:hypothetical protein FocnCong_v014856 [Fusarium oxysporum f. sp. conglutinans]|nr:hypothetical protein FocnCong_v014856 [Fusarium oxysporum f. sp. conglutinans]
MTGLATYTDAIVTLRPSQLQKLESLGLYYNSPEPAIICIECGFAINPTRAPRHPGDKHHIPKSARRGLKPLIYSLNLPNPETLPLRPNGSPPHPNLTVYKGSACKHCGLRSISEKVLLAHVKSKHSKDIKLAARQQTRHWLSDHIQQGLSFQSWSANDIRRSWIIADNNPSRGSLPCSTLLQACPDAVKLLGQKLFSDECARLGGVEGGRTRRYDSAAPVSIALQTNWMRRTGWETMFQDTRRDILVALTELPNCRTNQPMPLGIQGEEVIYSLARDERKLASMMVALDRLLDQCGETVRRTDVCLRRWLRSRFPDRPYKAPFELVAKPSSEKVYRKELKRFICFWLRLSRLLPTTMRAITGRGLNRHQFRALRELWVDGVWQSEEPADMDRTDNQDGGQSMNDHESGDDGGEEEENDDDDYGDEEDEGEDESECEESDGHDTSEYDSQSSVAIEADDLSDAESTSAWSLDNQEQLSQDPAADVLLRFCYFAIAEDFEGGLASSTMLVYFSAVRGLSTPNGNEYLQPHRFTPVLARLIYCSRLVFLEAVLPHFSRIYGGIARPPRHGLLRRLNAARREYMCDGTLSPMGEFLSLLSYGNALRRSQGSTFRFHWSDDGEVLSWNGNQRLSMVDFRGLACKVLRSVTASCSRLMYDWEPTHIDLSLIRDNLSTTTPGYSFVSDPVNQLTDAYPELLLRACISPVDGLLQEQGQNQSAWDAKAARAYLEAHDDHLKGLMVLCNFDGGQCARITELLTLECFNTASRERGIGLWDGKMCSIIRHHKARLATNNEFYVVRFFSKPVSRLIFQYLVYIRPVAITILLKCFDIEHTNALLFSPLSQVGQKSTTPWTASTFTKELRRHCSAATGIPPGIGVQMYRQISIAITERHVHAAAARFNRFGDTTGTAEHEVAYAWQSGHRPMQRHTTYGLDGAFPDHLQPALLRAYERVSASWQNFLWGCDKSGEPRSIPVEADRSQLNYASTHHSLTPSQKRPFISDLEESPSNNKRLRLRPDLSSVRGTMSTEAIAQPSSEESLVIGIEEDVNSFTCDYMSRPSPEGDDEAVEPISDDAPLRIGPFVHIVELNLVICLDCKTAILAKQVKAHLVDPLHRQHLTLKERRNISNQILEIPNILKDTDDLQHWKFPPPEAEPIPYLEPPLHNGLGCNSCRYIGRDLRRIREHYRQEHSDVLERGNPVDLSRLDQQSDLWRNDVTYQRMFRGGQKSSWFEVSRAEAKV